MPKIRRPAKIQFKLTEEEKAQLVNDANMTGLSQAEFIRQSILLHGSKLIADAARARQIRMGIK